MQKNVHNSLGFRRPKNETYVQQELGAMGMECHHSIHLSFIFCHKLGKISVYKDYDSIAFMYPVAKAMYTG